MADIPSISITNEFSDNDEDKTENQIDLVATDCENLDSESDSGRVTTSGNKLVAFTKNRRKSKKEDLTDCEDFTDVSDSEQSEVPEVVSQYEITLEEFLDQAYTDETTKFNGNKQSSHDGPRKKERCHSPMLKNKNLGVETDPGGVTDCEDMNDSGDEDDAPVDYTEFELPIYIEDNNTVESHDNVRSVLGHHHVTTTDSTVSSASSGDEHTPYKTKGKQNLYPHSDTENLLFSDYESALKTCPKKPIICDLEEDEVLNVELSDADDELASEVDTSRCIGVHFKNHIKELHKPGTPQFSKLLAVLQDPNEGLTDVENLNSSEDDEDECKPGYLSIPPAIVRTDNAYLTDTEDLDGVESEGEDEGVDVDYGINLPKPVRQLILVQETNTGAPVSRVMPLSDNLSPAADVGYLDKGLTDTEDLSDVNEDMYDISQYLIESLPDMEAGRVTSSDKYTASQLNLPGCSAEPVTDTEDMGEIKDTRKKRHKHRQSTRQKQRLAANVDDDDGHTDVEELLLSDQGHRRYSACTSQRSAAAPMLTINNNDDGGHTDIEIMSGDEETVPPRRMQRNSSPNILNKSDWFNSAVATKESMQEHGRKVKSNYLNMNLPRLRKMSPTPDAGHTDTEELARSGDDDDEEEQVRGETPAAVHEELDGNSSTTYDRNVSVFDEHSERLNIKGHRELQEALTDTEFIEEESKK